MCTIVYNKSSKPSRCFYVQKNLFQHLLFCDNNVNEDALPLDEEDIEFLKDDVDAIKQGADGVAETEAVKIVIDPTSASSENQNFAECNTSSSISSSIRGVKFSWNTEILSN